MARYILEVCGPKNESLMFGPTSERLRGRWESSKVASRDKSEGMKAMSAIPAIPGMCIDLDTDKGIARVFDPLRETEEGRAIWSEVAAVIRNHSMEFGNITNLPETREYRELTQDDLKTWMFELRKAVDIGLLRYLGGSEKLLSQYEIRTKVPGQRVRDIWNTGPQDKGEGEGALAKFCDNVQPPRAERKVPVGAGGVNENK